MNRIPTLVLATFMIALPALGDEEAKQGRSPEALEILEKVDATIKKVSSVRYASKITPSGVAENFVSPAEGSATMEGWNGSTPNRFHVHVKSTRPGTDESVELTGGGNGEMFFLVDHANKKCYEDMDPGVLGSSGNTLRSVGMMEYVHDAPFDDEFGADTVELQGTEEVAGEPCYKIRVVYSGGRGESVWFFSKNDYLPRRRIRKFSTPQGDGQIDHTITELSVNPKLEQALFTMKRPDGYEQIDDFAP